MEHCCVEHSSSARGTVGCVCVHARRWLLGPLSAAADTMAHLAAWAEHLWLRLRRMDYWDPAAHATNAAAKHYRARAPGALSAPAVVQKAEPGNVFSIRYYNRDFKRRDVGYYPDTPLSQSHALMQGVAARAPDTRPATLPHVQAHGWQKISGTPAAMGMRGPAPRQAGEH